MPSTPKVITTAKAAGRPDARCARSVSACAFKRGLLPQRSRAFIGHAAVAIRPSQRDVVASAQHQDQQRAPIVPWLVCCILLLDGAAQSQPVQVVPSDSMDTSAKQCFPNTTEIRSRPRLIARILDSPAADGPHSLRTSTRSALLPRRNTSTACPSSDTRARSPALWASVVQVAAASRGDIGGRPDSCRVWRAELHETSVVVRASRAIVVRQTRPSNT